MKKLFFVYSVCLLAACHKEVKCETWEYYETCTPKRSNVICGSQNPNITSKFCGNDLNGIYPGATKVRKDDADVKIVQHFVRKIS